MYKTYITLKIDSVKFSKRDNNRPIKYQIRTKTHRKCLQLQITSQRKFNRFSHI